MTTLADMIAEIKDDTERSSETDAIRKKIQAAIRHYQPKRFWFNESRSVTFSTVASTAEYSFSTIGTEFYQIDGAYLSSDDQICELDRVDYTSLEPGPETALEGTPTAYAYINDAIRLGCVPDDVFSVRLVGHVKLEAPTDDAGTTAWMEDAYDLIMSRAKAELYAHRWEDPSNAQVMRLAEQDALRVLLGGTHDKVAPGHLEATDF